MHGELFSVRIDHFPPLGVYHSHQNTQRSLLLHSLTDPMCCLSFGCLPACKWLLPWSHTLQLVISDIEYLCLLLWDTRISFSVVFGSLSMWEEASYCREGKTCSQRLSEWVFLRRGQWVGPLGPGSWESLRGKHGWAHRTGLVREGGRLLAERRKFVLPVTRLRPEEHQLEEEGSEQKPCPVALVQQAGEGDS